MWELDCEESWMLKNWCFWTALLEKSLESPLDCKEIQTVHSEGDQPWGFFGRNDAKAESPVLWPPHVKSWLIGKDSDAGTDWGQEEKGTTEDEMAGWHHWVHGRESEWTPGVGGGQRGLACCDSWGCKESDMTERLNWTDSCVTGDLWTLGASGVFHSLHNFEARMNFFFFFGCCSFPLSAQLFTLSFFFSLYFLINLFYYYYFYFTLL